MAQAVTPKPRNTRTKPKPAASVAPAPKNRSLSAAPPVDKTRERAGLAVGALGLASLLGMVSFTRNTNWVGPVGHVLADLWLGLFGVGAYPFIFVLLLCAVFWLLGKRAPFSGPAIMYAVGIFLSSSVLITLFVSGTLQKHPPAGALGVVFSGYLVSLFSVPGSTILASAVLFGSLIMLAGIEFKQVLEALGSSGKVIASPVLAGVGLAQEAWREAKEAHEIARAEAAAIREQRRMERLDGEEEYEDEAPEEEVSSFISEPIAEPVAVEEPKRKKGRTKPDDEPSAEEQKSEPIISSHPSRSSVLTAEQSAASLGVSPSSDAQQSRLPLYSPAPKMMEEPSSTEAPRQKKNKTKASVDLPSVEGAALTAAAVTQAATIAAPALALEASIPAIIVADVPRIPQEFASPTASRSPLSIPEERRGQGGERSDPQPAKVGFAMSSPGLQSGVIGIDPGDPDDEAIGAALAAPVKPAMGPAIIAPPVRPKPAALTAPEPKISKKEPITQDAKPDPFANYQLPPLSFLDYREPKNTQLDRATLTANARKLEQKLLDYHVPGNVVEIHPGPVITMYEFCPGPGIKVSKIAGLSDDLAMALQAERVRIIAPIPGKNAVGIEIPNASRETVYLKEILADNVFQGAESPLCLGIGKDVSGAPKVADLSKMPHLLVAGATGAGKSVAINTFICSILFKATPKEVRFLMVDPKMLELSVYEGIPHLLLPVVTDMKKASLALRWAVDEMERRYQLLAEAGVRNINNYNKKCEQRKAELERAKQEPPPESDDLLAEASEVGAPDPLSIKKEEAPEALPYIVVIIDELADLMMVASREVETSIARLAQMARAAGIHLILATQRPSVDVITGLIKANFPTRVSFQVTSRIDSRTILDQQGAENLLGMGDMLIMERGKVIRCHGALVQEEEIHRTVEFLKQQGTPVYDESILAPRDEDGEVVEEEEEDKDPLYDQALAIVMDSRQASTSMIQRKLKIGYNRAARLVELFEKHGIVGPADGAKPREVLIHQ